MGDPFIGLAHPCKAYNLLRVNAAILYMGPRPSHISEILYGLNGQLPGAVTPHGDASAAVKSILELNLPCPKLRARISCLWQRAFFQRRFCRRNWWRRLNPPANRFDLTISNFAKAIIECLVNWTNICWFFYRLGGDLPADAGGAQAGVSMRRRGQAGRPATAQAHHRARRRRSGGHRGARGVSGGSAVSGRIPTARWISGGGKNTRWRRWCCWWSV